jgi:hypothetical protein
MALKFTVQAFYAELWRFRNFRAKINSKKTYFVNNSKTAAPNQKLWGADRHNVGSGF